MGSVFTAAPGSVVRVNSQRPVIPFRIDCEFATARAIITQAAIEQEGGYQFLHTISDFIYLYVFGDRIGDMQISGIGFAGMCGGGQSGLDDVLDYYSQNRLSSRATPVVIHFGARTFEGFLVRAHVDQAHPELLLGQYSLHFKISPNL